MKIDIKNKYKTVAGDDVELFKVYEDHFGNKKVIGLINGTDGYSIPTSWFCNTGKKWEDNNSVYDLIKVNES